MTEAASSSYSVLLPAARVAVFSRHAETRAAVSALAEDWRFARIQFNVQEGDVAAAIAAYTGTPSPNLLIVDTDVIDSSFTALLEQLAGACSEGTDAVVVGPVNDIALYRYLINLGVSDYLVRPLQAHMIADVIARILLQQLGASDSQLIAVIGAKGGAGASTIAQMLAYGLAEVEGHKTVILDAAGARSSLPVCFGFEPVTTMAEASRAAMIGDSAGLGRMLLKFGKNLQIMGSGNDVYFEPDIGSENIEKMIDRLMAVTPFVVADLSGASPMVQRAVIARAHRIMMVSVPMLASLRIARTLIAEIRDLRGGNFEKIDLVINMTGIAAQAEVARADIESALDHKIAISVPYDPKLIMGAEAQSKPAASAKGAEKIIADLLAPIGAPSKPATAGAPGGSLFENLLRKALK